MFKRAELKITLFDETDVIQTSDSVGAPDFPDGDGGGSIGVED